MASWKPHEIISEADGPGDMRTESPLGSAPCRSLVALVRTVK